MTWFKADDKLASHPKVRKAGVEAMGLWVLAGTECALHLTDGVVTRESVQHLAGARGEKLAERLVAAKLWHVHPDGWLFHEWHEHQPSREEVLADRARRAASGRLGGRRSGESRRSKSEAPASPNDAETRSKVEAPASRLLPELPKQTPSTGGSELSNPRPVPSRPDPKEPHPFGVPPLAAPEAAEPAETPPPPPEPASTAKRGTRLPADWKPSLEDERAARELGLDPARVAAKFRDFWHAKTGKDATKLDWSATWRNWCRRDAEQGTGSVTRIRPRSGSAYVQPTDEGADWMRYPEDPPDPLADDPLPEAFGGPAR